VPDRVEEFYGLEIIEALDKLKAVGLFAELAVHGRAEDYNQDGRFDIAESFFHSDPFRLCASFWQDLVDMMQMVKIVRSLRQDAVPSDPLENPAEATYEELKPYLFSGDFNADGILDVGGPNVALSLAGTSLGGIHSVMGAAIEPEIKTVTPIVAGAGLADIMTRSGLHFILGPLFTDVFGNLIVGCVNEGTLYLSQGDDANRCRDATVGAFASTDVLAEGTEVVLENLNNGLKSTTIINGDGGFATAVDSDIGDSLRLTLSPEDGETQTFETEAKFEGAGYRRNSSEFRQAVGIQQHAFDLCDPANFARHLFIDPLPGHTTKNVLFMNAIGDDTVPVATSIQLGLAAGVFGRDQSDWEPLVKRLIDRGILLNSLYDVHDLLGDNPEDEPAIGLFEPIETDTGVSSMRLADVNGKHEWIAGYDRNGFAFGRYSQNQVAVFHACEGRVILDHPAQCLQAEDCEIMDKLEDIEGCNPVGLSE